MAPQSMQTQKQGEVIMKSYYLQPQMQPNPTNNSDPRFFI